uniref:Cyclin D-type n=1 Tax=Persea americana TaxID=3435 RepID=H6WW35_PERAE|nr:cyclin D-type [Persea americana]|eukprot:TRINITY_DN4868_c3_g1_i1.p1 TRINITY_DN4868_c3_g1~~TRINITY_DN4868_c3_g1_i1.p1  ORF type:complete len:335 (+),score=23.23 TRINITY_DN4868_c3_g1_i1:277-1281(+)
MSDSDLSSSSTTLLCPEDPPSWDAGTWPPSDRSIPSLLDSEPHHMPQSDYLHRFHDRSLDVASRQDAVNWILKVHEHYRFRPVTAYLSVNYLDRFLSSHSLPRGYGWPLQLLSVACLSVAVKLEETEVPLLLDLQLFEPQFMFENRTIGRMEVMVMASLKWRMRSVTPFDFVDYFAERIESFGARNVSSDRFFCRVSELILSTHRVIDFLGFRSSTMAAAAVLCTAREIADFSTTVELYPAIFPEMASHEEKIWRCQQLMEEYMIDACPPSGLAKDGLEPAPQSPSGVLDAAACGSCGMQQKPASQEPESSQSEPSSKRHKPNSSTCTDTNGAR